jgi:hypothetical protein
MYPVSQQFMDTWMSSSQKVISKVDVYNNGTYLATLTGTEGVVSGATVSFDETAQTRTTCSLTVAGTEYIPNDETDLLHPASCNELYFYRGFQYAVGIQELVPLGVFRMTDPEVTDDGQNVSIAINGSDRSSVISGIVWQEPYPIAAGTTLGEAIEAIFNDRWPMSVPLVFNIDASAYDVVLPATVLGADLSGSNDPMADAITLAGNAGGFEVFFDVVGALTCRPIPDPTTTPVVAQLVEGPTCVMTQANRSFNQANTKNGVIAIGNGVSGSPIQVTVWNTNPDSPTYYLGEWGQNPYILTTTAIPAPGQSVDDATAQLTQMALAQLQLLLGAFDTPGFSCVPNGALQAGDCLQMTRTRIKLDDTYVLSSGTIPLDVESMMTGNNRPRVQTS